MSVQSLNSYELLTASNWDEWNSTLKAYLMTKGLLDYLLKETFLGYKMSDAQATAGNIILRAGRDFHYLCHDASNNALPPKQMWDNLLLKHEKVGAPGKVLAILRVTRPYVDGTPIQSHISLMRNQLSHCAAIGMRFETDIQAAFQLASLASSTSWGDIASTISASASTSGEPTFAQAVEKLLIEEQRRQSTAIQSGTYDPPSSSSSASAATARSNWHSSSPPSRQWEDDRPIKCTVPNCAAPTTHYNDRCWTYYGFPPEHSWHDPEDWAAKAKLRSRRDANKAKARAQRDTDEEITTAAMGLHLDADYDDFEDREAACAALSATTTEVNDASIWEWTIDTAASKHYCRSRACFSSYTVSPSTVITATGEKVHVLGHGTIRCLLPTSLDASSSRSVRLLNVQHVPSFAFNLLSVPMIDRAGGKVILKNGSCTVLDRDDNTLAVAANRTGSYQLIAQPILNRRTASADSTQIPILSTTSSRQSLKHSSTSTSILPTNPRAQLMGKGRATFTRFPISTSPTTVFPT